MAYDTQANEETVAKQLALANHICEVMNTLLALDPKAVKELVCTRVRCNAYVANHSCTRVVTTGAGELLGLLGVLNAIIGVGVNGEAVLFAVCTAHDEKIVKFEVAKEALLLVSA